MSHGARGGVWAQFFTGTAPVAPTGGRVDRYLVQAVAPRVGAPIAEVEPGMTLVRVEAPAPQPAFAGGFTATGVVQHVVYTDADRRRALAQTSAGEGGPHAVLIPVAKSEAWWALAQDERERFFRAAPERPGHVDIGSRYAPVIFRRLYHARYQPGSAWDFLTYFEFTEADAGAFRRLLAELRDPRLNPEWAFVERETEIWMTKL